MTLIILLPGGALGWGGKAVGLDNSHAVTLTMST